MLFTVASALSTYPLAQRLDAEILLAYVLHVDRAYLHTYPDKILTLEQQDYFKSLMNRRLQGEPVAYLTGSKAFWSIELAVTPAVLVPRPETELLVELALQVGSAKNITVADLGTGSGAIALALAREKPDWQIYATDISADALNVAINNAKQLAIHNITFCQGHWCDALPAIAFDMIISNPPYIAVEDTHLMQSVYDYEPHAALFAKENGLADIRRIVQTAMHFLKSGGCLLLEHGFQQATAVRAIFSEMHYVDIKSTSDLHGLDRVTWGKRC